MKIVAYYRVSTREQGESGLGLEGQRATVAAFARQSGAEIIGEYTEVESGKRNNRPKIKAASAHAKRSKATLVIAKLDRLARNVYFVSGIMESGVDFVCCDNPHANPLTIHILAAVAEAEAKAISERTRVALQAAKARGVKLGSAREGHWEGHEEARLRGLAAGRASAREARQKRAKEAYTDLEKVISDLRAVGQTLREIAERLNAMGHTTTTGKPWGPMQVLSVLRRAATAGVAV